MFFSEVVLLKSTIGSVTVKLGCLQRLIVCEVTRLTNYSKLDYAAAVSVAKLFN